MKNDIIIQKMLAYALKIIDYTRGMGYEQFKGNPMLIEACVFNLGQMGELAGKVDAEFAEALPDIPWKQLKGLRNRIVHDYEGVNPILIWEIIENDLPALAEILKGTL